MRRVLIVDDDPRVRAALTALITATTDLSVTAAVGTARDAWAALATRPVDLILIDVQPYGTTQVAGSAARDDVLNVGGFSDAVFDVLSAFTRGDLAGDGWLRAIESIVLD